MRKKNIPCNYCGKKFSSQGISIHKRYSHWEAEQRIKGQPLLHSLIKPESIINSPIHYTSGPIECIEAIKSALTPEEFRGFCKGNIIKYIWRERHKGGAESLKKAGWYLDRIAEEETDAR